MILTGIFQTVEFYVITAFVAAAVIAAVAMPSQKGAARTFFFSGILHSEPQASEPAVTFTVDDDGRLVIDRFGLDGIGAGGAYSLAVTLIGFDVTIEERLTAGDRHGSPVTSATAVLDCFGAERYHFNYRSEATGRGAAFSLNIRPGNRIVRRLL
ncbi:MAG: hypothetical protein K2F91_07630 [Muribaculaceae bacterium]|nr:hypothetical protein [Muribaculaceae bacterium]